MMKSVAPLGIVPNLKAGLEEVGLERRESWTNRRRELMQLTTYPPIAAHLDPREVEELLPGDHEGGEVGGVDGEEDQGEQRPHIGHQPRRVTLEKVFLYFCASASTKISTLALAISASTISALQYFD